MFGRDTYTGIADAHRKSAALTACCHRQVAVLPAFHSFQGIVDEIPETLAEVDIVPIDERQALPEVKFFNNLMLENRIS
jgi:hypothetical protein